jgi:pSer/pThr/pTyr-binding forkhead associated (FHA) protein
MPEPLLNVLKICLLVLLYLFFFRVLRAVWAEVGLTRSVAPAAAPAAPKKATRRTSARTRRPPQLRVVEPAALAGTTYSLADELTVGRAAGCQITLDDTFISQIHARIFQRDGQFLVEDLGSTNGTYLNKRKVSSPMVLQTGDKVQIGSVILEFG